MSRSERICRICDEGVTGEEIHFLFECQKLEDLRIKYMALGDGIRPNECKRIVEQVNIFYNVNYVHVSFSALLMEHKQALFQFIPN